MRHLRTYRLFEQQDHEDIRAELEQLNIRNYTIRPDGTVDVKGDVDLRKMGNTPRMPVRFGKVDGGFWCHGNLVTSLDGAPEEVGGDFWCDDNLLTSLTGGPRKVRGHFHCNWNRLTSLEGAPEEVGGNFRCHENRLTSLEGAPEKVGGAFTCYDNQLTDLVGAPKEVGGDFTCSHNRLTSLEGLPTKIDREFYCVQNPVPNRTLKRIFEVMQHVGGSYTEALGALHERGELARLEGFEKLQGLEQFPDLRGRALGSKFGI